MGDQVRIVIASDMHYLASELQDRGKAFTEMMSVSDGRLTDLSKPLLDTFIRKMLLIRPDAVVLTGDLTFNAEKISHEQIRNKLLTLKENGIPVLSIPGNHDLDNPMAGSYLGDEAEAVESITKEQFRRWYQQELFFALKNEKGVISSYPSSLGFVYAVSEKLWIMAIDVNGNTYPGEVSRGILVWAEGQLKRAKERGITVIGISHQNLLGHNSMLSGAYQMIGAEKLMNLYQQYQVKLHLSGHMHVQHIGSEHGITEIVSSSLMIGACQYGILTIEEHGNAAYHTEDLEEYASYGTNYFLEFYRQKTLWELKELLIAGEKMEEGTADRLARGLAALNLAYYNGRLDLVSERDMIWSEWKKEAPESFWNAYLDSFMKEECRNHTTWSGQLR